MAETLFRGPGISIGALMDGRVEPFDGPSVEYQGDIIPDPRLFPANKDSLSPGAIKGFFNNPYFTLVDCIPSASNTASIAAAQNPTTTVGLALTLVTAQAGTAAGVAVFSPGIPIVPVGTTTITTVSAIDFGFTTGTTVANSTTLTVVDNSLFTLGQWLCIPGAGGTTNRALFTQVQSQSTNSTILTISPAPQTGLSNVPIGQGNLYSQLLPPATQFGPGVSSASATEPYRLAGFALAFDPMQGCARALSVTAASIGSGTTAVLVTGYDIYGNLMTESITANGTTTVNGKKAFKYVSTVTTLTAATTVTPANITIGHSDVTGLNLRSDKWEFINVFWNGGFAINSTGWTKALSTTSTNTSADVRGTQNLSTALTGTGVVASTDGVRRLTIMMSVPFNNMINATPLATSSLFGTPQV